MTWIGITGAVLAVYIGILWWRNRQRSRFQARLSILFLLFVVIPTIPLAYFAASLLTQSANVLLLPGIGEALDISLETIRLQTEECGKIFLSTHGDPGTWTEDLLQKERIHFASSYRFEDDRFNRVRLVHSGSSLFPSDWDPPPELFDVALAGNSSTMLVPVGEREGLVLVQSAGSSSVQAVGILVPDLVLNARDKITRALDIYNTLSLLKESIIRKNLIWSLAVLLVLGLALTAILVARRLSMTISRPVRELVGGMHRVAEGDLTHPVDVRTKDEFRFLVDSFNQMIEDLRVSREKLIQAERLAAWQQVARQISHEIRNSLTPISVSLRRFRTHLEKEGDPKKVPEILKTIQEEIRTMESMAAEFSDFARMPAPKKSTTDLNELIQSVVRLMSPATGQVNIKTQLAPDLPDIETDGDLIKRLLNNLIKNAVEASHDTGTVTVTTASTDGSPHRIILTVEDRGEGMDEETLENIFQPYYTTKRGGTGLGLVIVRKIVEDHGGEISVKSEKDAGTRFSVHL